VNGIAYGMGAYTPRSSSGSITLDDSPHSFGFERRLSDLLERYTVLDQEAEVLFQAGTDLDDHLGSSGSAVVIFRGLVLDWKKDVRAQNLTLRVKGEDLSRDVVTRTINATDFPNAPAESLGKNLPIVFGTNIDVKPVLISASGSTAPSWATMTTFKDQFVAGGLKKNYVKDSDGIYREFASAPSITAGIYARGELTPTTSEFNVFDEFANKISVSTGAIITHARIRCAGTGFAGWLGGNGTLELNIYLPDERGRPGERIATASRAKADYQTNFRGGTGTRFWIDFAFLKPVIIGVGRATDFFFSVAELSPDDFATDDEINICGNNTTGNIFYWVYNTRGTRNWRESGAYPQYRIPFDLFGVKLTETTSTATDGSGLSYAKVDSSVVNLSPLSSPSLTDLDIVFSTDGLKDVGGQIATAGSIITRPDDAIRLLTRYYAGGTWNNALLDPAIFSDSTTGVSSSTDRYFRAVGGRTDGRAVAAQVIEDIARSCAVRVAHVISSTLNLEGKPCRFARWCWSTNRATQWIFTNRNSNILEIEQRDAATVVNKATAYFGESLRGLTVESGSAEGGFKNYSNVAQTFNGLDAMATALTSESVTIYGERPNSAAGYKWLNSDGRFVTDYLCALFGKPHTYVSLEVPLFADGEGFAARPYELHCLDVVEILHPELFAYFGTSADPGASTFAGTATDPSSGAYIVRAQTYRAQIEGKEFIFSDNETAKIRFSLRLLTNYPNDPT
jgi:hypothetical protein